MKSFSRGVLFLIAVPFACSSKSSNTTADSGLSGSAACMDEANALCALRASCSNDFNITKNWPDMATCVSRTSENCDIALSAPGTAQTPGKIEACAAEYPSEACTDYFDGNPVSSCIPPAGSAATGAACGVSAQCASTYCAIASTAICGTCQPLPVVGATCMVNADCGRDLACAIPANATTGTCAAYVASGGACLTDSMPCQAGLACVGDDVTTSTMGTCQALGATVGAPCDGTRKTMPNCNGDDGLACIPTAKGSAVGTCQTIVLAAAGSACGDVGAAPITGVIDCEAGGECIKAGSATTGTCAAAAADGAACNSDDTIGPPCLTPAKCVPTGTGTAGTCTLPNPTTCS
jgi:hypothetical protein